ncbi:MAG TPA: DNA-3-methyladenine glycosylase 2 family protein [Actinomycetota bacterium]|jgi:3-methyladenine DNA glycosylase/8-oxoguanine DNA glycosylase
MHGTRTVTLDGPIDLRLTLGHLRRGTGDPTLRVNRGEAWRAHRTEAGPAAVRMRVRADGVELEAWGTGATVALEAAPELLGRHDRPGDFRPGGVLRDLAGRLRGLRIGRTGAVIEALVPAILEQKVTGREAWAAWRRIVLTWGEPAPGPLPVRVPPDPEVLAGTPYFELHRAGVERRRSELIRFVCARARRIEETTVLPRADAHKRLLSIPGIGPWTVAEVAGRAWGDPDAVSLGDYHLPHLVSWVLAGEPRGDDDRMLELLEPYRGQRGRVIRLLEAGAPRPPRRGPRMAPRSIRTI